VRKHRDGQSQALGSSLPVQQSVGPARDVRLCWASANETDEWCALVVADVNDDGYLIQPRGTVGIDALVTSGGCVAKSPASRSCAWKMSLAERARKKTSLSTARVVGSSWTFGD
jgi:hypothetical protein